jgi:hypothetical protein
MLSNALRHTSRALARAPPLPGGALGGARGLYVAVKGSGIEVSVRPCNLK